MGRTFDPRLPLRFHGPSNPMSAQMRFICPLARRLLVSMPCLTQLGGRATPSAFAQAAHRTS